ncbi:DNA recombination protein RmuC [Actinomycetales bacterium JB111]|nr:DNA recombination protein RmuC [Actinomycetales bacterium JB111]
MTIGTGVFLLVLGAALALGVVMGWLVRGAAEAGRGASAREAAAVDRERARMLQAELADMRQRSASDAEVARSIAPLRESLERVGDRVAALDRERAAAEAALNEQLAEARRSDRALQRATDDLGRALHSRSSRGVWGEVELRRVVEAAGMLRHVDFAEQRTTSSLGGAGGSTGRPDVVVQLPGQRTIAVDAKVPMDAYLEAAAIDPAARGDAAHRREKLLADHARALRSHVDALASRAYHADLPGSAELVVLFIPSEPLLGAALEADPGLLEHALRKGVAPTSPASLLALLRAVAAVWVAEQSGEQAGEILDLGRTLTDRLGVVVGHVEKLGASLRGAVGHYNSAVGSIESRLLVTARSLSALGAEGLGATPIAPDDAQVRAFTAPELAGGA